MIPGSSAAGNAPAISVHRKGALVKNHLQTNCYESPERIMNMETKTDFLIIGSGVAGLTFALKVAAFGSVALVTKNEIM